MRAPPDRLLSLAEVAAFTGRSVRSVRRWIADGRLRAARLGGAVWVPEKDLLRALGIAEAEPSAEASDPEKDAV